MADAESAMSDLYFVIFLNVINGSVNEIKAMLGELVSVSAVADGVVTLQVGIVSYAWGEDAKLSEIVIYDFPCL